MPLTGYLGAYIIYPILGDYIRSLAVACAIVLSLFVLVYIISFDKYIIKKFQLSSYVSSFVTVVFLVFHFLCFKTKLYNNEFLLSSIDITCIFNYTIPALLNSSLVLFLLRYDLNDELKNKRNSFNVGILCLALYLALCSNLYENAILAIFVSLDLFYSLIELKLKDKNINKFGIKNKIQIVVVIGWIFTLIFELSGKRAMDLSSGKSFDIYGAMQSFIGLLLQTNKLFVLISGIIVIVFGIILFMNKDINILKEWIKLVITCILVCIYVVLLSGKVSVSYAGRSDVFLSVGFYVILCVCFSLAYIMKKESRINIFIPIIVFILFCQVINASKSFKDINGYQLSWEQCKNVDDYILLNITEADRKGQDCLQLSVPKGNADFSNWPHATYMGSLISDTLYRHGIISKPIAIEISPDENINQKFNLTY